MNYEFDNRLNVPFSSDELASRSHTIPEPHCESDDCHGDDDHKEVAVSALKKQGHVEDAASADVDVCESDAFAYHDDVSSEGIAEVRARAGNFLSKKKWKVVDGYVGSDISGVD